MKIVIEKNFEAVEKVLNELYEVYKTGRIVDVAVMLDKVRTVMGQSVNPTLHLGENAGEREHEMLGSMLPVDMKVAFDGETGMIAGFSIRKDQLNLIRNEDALTYLDLHKMDENDEYIFVDAEKNFTEEEIDISTFQIEEYELDFNKK
jgi:hypothetical protein